MLSQETINTMILTRLSRFRPSEILEFYKNAGSATKIIEHKNDIKALFPDASNHLIYALKDIDLVRDRVEKEIDFIEKNHIKVLTFNDEEYPQRLKECPDAPLALYFKGSTSLNPHHSLDIIGTRHVTPYGKDLIESFVKELKTLCPDVLIFSGLAYGVDINAHRAALENGFDTVGVLAHGLDMIYPRAHQETANQMLHHGGLLTEYMSVTQPFARNFVQRNRIVAGCSDATILIESASKGGGLITCGIARSYSRDVFAFPGPVGADFSEGCNNLIRDNGAALITSASDFVRAMGWEESAQVGTDHNAINEGSLFPSLTPDEEKVVTVLKRHNDLQVNMLSTTTDIPFSSLTSILFELEMKGLVKPMAGGTYHLIAG